MAGTDRTDKLTGFEALGLLTGTRRGRRLVRRRCPRSPASRSTAARPGPGTSSPRCPAAGCTAPSSSPTRSRMGAVGDPDRPRRARARRGRRARSPCRSSCSDSPRRALADRREPLLRRPARGDGRGHRHQRQDLGRELHPPDLGGARRDARSTSAPSASRARSRRRSAHTTPEPIALHRLLAELADKGVTHAAMEASSHGLDQRRLDGVQLAAAGFTNITRDHLDYHADFEAYFAGQARRSSSGCCRGTAPRSSTSTTRTARGCARIAKARGQRRPHRRPRRGLRAAR